MDLNCKENSSFENCNLLLTYLFRYHFGLTINDTPFHDSQIVTDIMDTDDLLLDIINDWVIHCDLVRIERQGLNWFEKKISSIIKIYFVLERN
ncbi:hypothetical protein M2403_002697 [Rahnella sp. BIGb0603]|uniref:TA system toxin CbtA family protein n=1 Tax=Rahnella sp. BIGb0603 TaxID=2940612 RepID=UPI0038620BB9|nr:hypothetical protein [Rahnella sp. BIGb0603]